MSKILKVLITNAASKTVLSFLPMLGNGDVFGNQQKLHLVLFAFKPLMKDLQLLALELSECCYPVMEVIETTSDMTTAFEGINIALLFELERNVIGFKTNSVLFRTYGLFINGQANKEVKIVVSGRTANTSAFICSSFCPSINPHNFTILTQHLKHYITSAIKNRSALQSSALFQLDNSFDIRNDNHSFIPNASTKNVKGEDIGDNLVIPINGDVILWGSCSSPAISVLENGEMTHIKDVKLGFKHPGAMVTAKALAEHLRYWLGSPDQSIDRHEAKATFCMGVVTSGNHLNIDNNLYFGLPVFTTFSSDPLKFSRSLELDEASVQVLRRISDQLSKERDAAIVDCWRVVLPHSHM